VTTATGIAAARAAANAGAAIDTDVVITVALVDDHQIVREGIRAILEQSSRIVVIGEAGDATAALSLIRRTQPNVVMLDLQLPGAHGAELCRAIMQESPTSTVLILSAFLNPHLLGQCLQAGACGYLLKDTENLDIVASVHAVANGQTVFDKRVAGLKQEVFGKRDGIIEHLSPKELQVLFLLCRGLSNNEIALELTLAVNTIKAHIKSIMRKLDCRNRVEIVVRARELNLI
jgi:DNA-binding NarL/FixJ family response regulator